MIVLIKKKIQLASMKNISNSPSHFAADFYRVLKLISSYSFILDKVDQIFICSISQK